MVELMGGLGNQLFQVAALISTGLKLRPAFSVALPDVPTPDQSFPIELIHTKPFH